MIFGMIHRCIADIITGPKLGSHNVFGREVTVISIQNSLNN